MKSKFTQFKVQAIHTLVAASTYQQASRIGLYVGLIAAHAAASAQGFITGLQNLSTLGQATVGLLILIGLVGGLGMVLGGLVSWYKKDKARNEDITWTQILTQVGAGGMAMALGWVGVQVVETLGGSASDIGKTITR